MTFDNLVTKLIEESTSKAPKGDSYDSQNNWKPSGVSSDSDGPGGRYRRTRPNTPGRSKATHGGRGVQDEEDTDTVEITLPKDLADVLHDLLMTATAIEDHECSSEDCETCGCEDGKPYGHTKDLLSPEDEEVQEEGFFTDVKKAFNKGKEAELYKGHEDEFIKMIDPHVEGYSREFLEALKDGINPEKQLERLEKEIQAAIKANGGLAKTIKKLVMMKKLEGREEARRDPEEDAEYRGRKVTLNKPTRGDVKKFKVYVKDPKTGNVKKVNFGHGGTSAKRKGEKTMKIRKSNPKARKSFRARHNCDNPGPKTKARYWSCRKW